MPKPSLTLDFSAKPVPLPESCVDATVPPGVVPALTVGELGRRLRRLLESNFDEPVWVEGEVVGARPATSGHLYFSLKDDKEDASIDVAMYKNSITPQARHLVGEGGRIRLRGRPSYWSPRGRLQFIAERVEAVGAGALLEALERLKAKLSEEGLFAEARKRLLPREPRIIGVVTSAGGAVIHDICKVAFRRGGAHILLAPALVQGAGAAESLRNAMRELARVPGVDVIILGRGGGSTDDLSAFNDEALVRAVAACPVPVVSAVGHEVDVTLTDFVADARAATPSQAAEMVVPDANARKLAVEQFQIRLRRAMRADLTDRRVASTALLKRLGDPRLAIAGSQQTLDDRVSRLEASFKTTLSRGRERLARSDQQLAALHPRVVIERKRHVLLQTMARIEASAWNHLSRNKALLAASSGRLDALSPLKVLGRGYAIATLPDGRALRRKEDVEVGGRIHVRLEDGSVMAQVIDDDV